MKIGRPVYGLYQLRAEEDNAPKLVVVTNLYEDLIGGNVIGFHEYGKPDSPTLVTMERDFRRRYKFITRSIRTIVTKTEEVYGKLAIKFKL